MGTEILPEDEGHIKTLAKSVKEITEYRANLAEYLKNRMAAIAPNLTILIGELVAAKLIAHSGSLMNLAKQPASTIQILGAEKALFRALKTKGKTPKYGLIFNSSFIGRAGQKNQGRISRYLANKCAIASRVDCFSDAPTSKFGEALKDQMEERLKFLASGTKPRKNKEAMNDVIEELKKEGLFYGDKVRVPKGEGDAVDEDEKKDKKKKDKKDKKRKHSEVPEDSDEEVVEKKDKKKKKKSKD